MSDKWLIFGSLIIGAHIVFTEFKLARLGKSIDRCLDLLMKIKEVEASVLEDIHADRLIEEREKSGRRRGLD